MVENLIIKSINYRYVNLFKNVQKLSLKYSVNSKSDKIDITNVTNEIKQMLLMISNYIEYETISLEIILFNKE